MSHDLTNSVIALKDNGQSTRSRTNPTSLHEQIFCHWIDTNFWL